MPPPDPATLRAERELRESMDVAHQGWSECFTCRHRWYVALTAHDSPHWIDCPECGEQGRMVKYVTPEVVLTGQAGGGRRGEARGGRSGVMDHQEQTLLEWFLLKKIAESSNLTAQFLDTQLTAPWGWWALASLASQHLVTIYGEIVCITDAGAEFAALLPSTIAAADTDPSSPPITP